MKKPKKVHLEGLQLDLSTRPPGNDLYILQAYALEQLLSALLTHVTKDRATQERILADWEDFLEALIARRNSWRHINPDKDSIDFIASDFCVQYALPPLQGGDRRESNNHALLCAAHMYEELLDSLEKHVKAVNAGAYKGKPHARQRAIEAALGNILSGQDIEKLKPHLEDWKQKSRERIACEAAAHLQELEPDYLQRQLPRARKQALGYAFFTDAQGVTHAHDMVGKGDRQTDPVTSVIEWGLGLVNRQQAQRLRDAISAGHAKRPAWTMTFDYFTNHDTPALRARLKKAGVLIVD